MPNPSSCGESSGHGSVDAGPHWFATTHWSVVLAAGRSESHEAHEALSKLCQTYWYPLYAYVRRSGYSQHDAQDVTQSFFASLLERGDFARAQAARGRFRSFLLGALRHFLGDEGDRARAQKRGGGASFVSLDDDRAEACYRVELRDDSTPEKMFERQWALTLLDQTLNRLQDDFTQAGKKALFDELKQFVTGDRGFDSYSAVAARLGISEPAVKMHVQRLRKRYRELLRLEIAQTVASPSEIEEELAHLANVLRG